MIDYDKLNDALNNEIEFTPENIATLFCKLSGDELARFFTCVADISDLWPRGCFAMQMQFVADSVESTTRGKSLMRIIGEYGQ